MADENNEQNEVDLTHLLDATYPLLQKFRENCPGTFKHSQALVSMMESISIALDLDVNSMKVVAQYHDIGKLNNPKYFTENQLDDANPHDKLDPYMSYQIISRHVADGVNTLLNNPDFPRKLIEIISQHHGTSIVRYFFDKSRTDIEDVYRYKCAKPKCVEAAALMLADHIEAKSRSLIQSDKFKDATDVVDNTVNELLDDGQLDEVYMRLGDLKRIKEALTKELEGSYQKRVDYDEAKKPKTKSKESNDEETATAGE
jgi:cyclic-di-AMP phosphodiesterase PgpH